MNRAKKVRDAPKECGVGIAGEPDAPIWREFEQRQDRPCAQEIQRHRGHGECHRDHGSLEKMAPPAIRPEEQCVPAHGQQRSGCVRDVMGPAALLLAANADLELLAGDLLEGAVGVDLGDRLVKHRAQVGIFLAEGRHRRQGRRKSREWAGSRRRRGNSPAFFSTNVGHDQAGHRYSPAAIREVDLRFVATRVQLDVGAPCNRLLGSSANVVDDWAPIVLPLSAAAECRRSCWRGRSQDAGGVE